MKDIMKILMSLEDVSLSTKGVTQTIENKTKEQKGGFLGMLIATLGTNLLGYMLGGKGVNRAGVGVNGARESF